MNAHSHFVLPCNVGNHHTPVLVGVVIESLCMRGAQHAVQHSTATVLERVSGAKCCVLAERLGAR